MKKLILLLSSLTFCLLGCESAGKKTAIGAGVGAAAGAAAGAIIGHQMGKRGKGAAIGAALGGGIGAAYGYELDKQAKELEKIAETKRTENGIITKLKGDILFSYEPYNILRANQRFCYNVLIFIQREVKLIL